MKKIALLHYAYPPHIGGVEMLLSEQARILSEMGLDILILTGSGKEESRLIRLVEIKELQSLMQFNPKLFEKIIKKGILDEDFEKLTEIIYKKLELYLADRETVIVHNMLTLVHNLPFIAAFKKYVESHPLKKYISWTHDQTYVDQEKVNHNKEGLNLNPILNDILLTPMKNTKYVVISETFKKLLARVLKMKEKEIAVIPNGINLKKFLEIDDSIWNLVKEQKLLEAFPLILSPVNILPRKNLEYSIDIISQMVKTYPKLRLFITGKPSIHREIGLYLSFIKSKIKDSGLSNHVLFLDDFYHRALLDSELHDFYDLSDLVFYFSKSENFGLPILEASLAKTAIFLSDLKVFHEIGGDNLNYINCKKIKPVEAAKKIKTYLDNNSLIKMNNLIKRDYNLETIIKEKLLPLI